MEKINSESHGILGKPNSDHACSRCAALASALKTREEQLREAEGKVEYLKQTNETLRQQGRVQNGDGRMKRRSYVRNAIADALEEILSQWAPANISKHMLYEFVARHMVAKKMWAEGQTKTRGREMAIGRQLKFVSGGWSPRRIMVDGTRISVYQRGAKTT